MKTKYIYLLFSSLLLLSASLNTHANSSSSPSTFSASLQVKILYFGMYGRLAEGTGLRGWRDQIESGQMTYNQVAFDFFYLQQEGINLGLAQMTRAEQVTYFYLNLFDREPDAAGLQYWTTGGGASVPAYLLVDAFANAAVVSSDSTDILALISRLGL